MRGTRLINRFSEKNSHLGKWSILVPKMAQPHNSGSTVKLFLKFCTIKGALGQLDLFIPFLTVWLGMVEIGQATVTIGSLNSQHIIYFMITTGSLNSQDMIRIISNQDLISQVNIYVMDVAWILCDVYVWNSKFNKGSHGFVKLL